MKMSLGHTFLKNKVDLLLSFELQKNIVECDFPIWILDFGCILINCHETKTFKL